MGQGKLGNIKNTAGAKKIQTQIPFVDASSVEETIKESSTTYNSSGGISSNNKKIINQALIKFKNLIITKNQLLEIIGTDLYEIFNDNPVVVRCEDVIRLINQFINCKIDFQRIFDWIEIIYYTGLYEFYNNEVLAVKSVLEVLEEQNQRLGKEDFEKMLQCLNENKKYNFI